MSRKPISDSTLKKLFSLSGNLCAFPNCKQCLVENNLNLIAQICHIEAAEVGGQRYNLKQSDEERRSFENLIILCPNHHKVTDDVQEYSVEKLLQMKSIHEQKYLNNRFVLDSNVLAEAKEQLSNQVNYHNSSSGQQIIAKNGNIIINYIQKEITPKIGNPFDFLKNIFTLKLDAKTENNSLQLIQKPKNQLNLEQISNETKRILKKLSKKQVTESDKTIAEILKTRARTKLDPKSKNIVTQVIQNLEQASLNDEAHIKRVSSKNNDKFANILKEFSASKSNLEIDEIGEIENRGLQLIEQQKSEIIFSAGKAYLDLLMLSKAKARFLQAYQINPTDINIVNDTLKLLINLEEIELANQIGQKTFQTKNNILDTENLYQFYNNLAFIESKQGEYDKALNLYNEVKSLLILTKDTNQSKLAGISLSIIFTYLVQGKLDEVLNQCEQVLHLIDPNIKIDKPDLTDNVVVSRIYNCLGIVYSMKNEFDKAYKYLKAYHYSLQLQSKSLYVESYQTAASMLNLAIVEFYRCNLKESKKYNLFAKDFIQDNISTDFSLLANVYATSGSIHILENESKQAQKEYARAMEILDTYDNRSNKLKTATILCHEANAFNMNNELHRSKNLYEKALSILSDLFDSENENMIKIKYNLINPQNTQNVILAF